MKLALVSYMDHGDSQIPIGLLTLAQIAREEGVRDVSVFDLPRRQKEQPFIEGLNEYDLVGFSTICSTYNQTIRLARRLHERNPVVPIVLGGPQASLTAKASLAAFPFLNAIFTGEAEVSWRAFLRSNSSGSGLSFADVLGVVWRNGECVHVNPPAPIVEDLETLPVPAFELYDRPRNAVITPVEIGRGCPFACTFCSTSTFFKRKFRLKSVKRVLAEMDRLHDLYGSRRFYFVQDAFSSKRKFVEEICVALARHHRSYSWFCSARTDQVGGDLLTRIKNAGCGGIYFGLETGSQRMQRVINKGLRVEDALGTIRHAADLGLEVTTSLIIGFPDETFEDLRETLRVFLDLKAGGHALVQLHVLAPLPGSALIGQGAELRYDGMPSDFSDTTQVLNEEDRDLVRDHAGVFANFWYFQNPLIPRERFLFLTHLLGVASLYFPNTLCLAAKHDRDPLLDRLLDGPMPDAFWSDPTFPANPLRWVGLTGEVLTGFAGASDCSDLVTAAVQYDLAYSRAELSKAPPLALVRLPAGVGLRPRRNIAAGLEAGGAARPYVVQKAAASVEVLQVGEEVEGMLSQGAPQNSSGYEPLTRSLVAGRSLFDVVDEACGTCGGCCFEEGGLLCGQDEWPAIADQMAMRFGYEPETRALDGGTLLLVQDHRKMSETETAAIGCAGAWRCACPALVAEDGRWRCSVESVKPAGCIAYPMKLVLAEDESGVGKPVITLEFEDVRGRPVCGLEAALRASPRLLNEYLEQVQARVALRPGTFALAAHNRANRLAAWGHS